MYWSVHSSTVFNSHKTENHPASFGSRMDKYSGVNPYNRTLYHRRVRSHMEHHGGITQTLEQRSQTEKSVCTVGFHLYNVQKRQNEYKVLEVRVVVPRGTRKVSGRLVMFGFSMWVLDTYVCSYFQNSPILVCALVCV